MDALLQHKANFEDCEVIFLFIEERSDRFANLEEKLDGIDLPDNVKVSPMNGIFADVVGEVLDAVEGDGHNLAPAFVMVDPFGPKGLPMALMHRITRHPRSELLISFMYESITRWLEQPAFEKSLDSLFGCGEWRDAAGLPPAERRTFLHDLYIDQLRKGGMEFVRSFEMRDQGNRTEYFLVYATKHIDGMKAMKRAMWSVDPSGTFQFSDATDASQPTFFSLEPDYAQLKALIVAKFGGHKGVRVEDIERFVIVDTAFHDGHYNRKVLGPMEKAGEIEVIVSPRSRKGAFPSGTVMNFA